MPSVHLHVCGCCGWYPIRCGHGHTLEAVVGSKVVIPEYLSLAVEPHRQLDPFAHLQRIPKHNKGELVREAITRVLHITSLQVGIRSPRVRGVAHVN